MVMRLLMVLPCMMRENDVHPGDSYADVDENDDDYVEGDGDRF